MLAEIQIRVLVMIRREIWPVMTRLQNAKNQLSEALAALESAASQASYGPSAESSALASPSQTKTQAVADADLSALVDEVSIIEAKLSEAMTMIASLDWFAVKSRQINDGDTQ